MEDYGANQKQIAKSTANTNKKHIQTLISAYLKETLFFFDKC